MGRKVLSQRRFLESIHHIRKTGSKTKKTVDGSQGHRWAQPKRPMQNGTPPRQVVKTWSEEGGKTAVAHEVGFLVSKMRRGPRGTKAPQKPQREEEVLIMTQDLTEHVEEAWKTNEEMEYYCEEKRRICIAADRGHP